MNTARSIIAVLTRRERWMAAGLIVLMLIGMGFETLGIGLVMPALAFLVRDDSAGVPRWAEPLLSRLGNPSQTELLLGGLAVLFVVYLLKVCFLVFMAYCQSRFVAGLQTSLSRRLFATYLSQPWPFHLGRNSAELIRNVDSIHIFAITCTALMTLLTELLVVLGVVGLLVCIEPTGAIVVGAVLGISAVLYDMITRSKLIQWGTRRHRHHAMVLRHLQEGLGGVKDVKVLGCEKNLLDRFGVDAEGLARMNGRQSLFQQIPRLWYELLAIAALCMLTAVMIWKGRPIASLVPILGVFGTAAFRLLPSVNRVALSAQQLRFCDELVTTLQHELEIPTGDLRPSRGPALDFGDSIRLDHVSYQYSGGRGRALDDVCLRIPRGASVGIIGGSGAGKSTLVDVILGLLEPSSGSVTVDGIDIARRARPWLNAIGYVPQQIYLADDTLRRNIAFGLRDDEIDEAAIARAVEVAQLKAFIATLPDGLDTVVGERGVRLSGGQRQRIGIARALYYDPPVLVLDEATSALDTETEREVMDAVNSLHGQKTLMIVAHRLSTIADCDTLYRLENGRLIASGSAKEILTR